MKKEHRGISTNGKIGRTSILLVCAFTFTFGFHQAFGMHFTGTPLGTIRAAAEAGDPTAQNTLAGVFIERGNFLAAELWYRNAAKQGHAQAQVRLAEMLLAHAGLTGPVTRNSAMAMASEAIQWLTLAANEGNTLAQAELAGVYLSGQVVKTDVLEAYKWGDIAAHAPNSIPGSAAGRSTRDAAVRKMSFDQMVSARQQVATFYSHIPFTPEAPDPAWVADIKLTGVSGPAGARLAIINNHTFADGETRTLKVAGITVQVHCLGVGEKSVMVKIAGVDRPRTLILADDTIKN